MSAFIQHDFPHQAAGPIYGLHFDGDRMYISQGRTGETYTVSGTPDEIEQWAATITAHVAEHVAAARAVIAASGAQEAMPV